MLAILRNGVETIICEVDETGKPKTEGYFTGKDGDQRELPTGSVEMQGLEEYTLERVEGPIRITTAGLIVEPERVLTSTA